MVGTDKKTTASQTMPSKTPKGKPRGLKGGRKKIGEERGGLVRTTVRLFADQDARLSREVHDKGGMVRAAVDQLIAQLDKQKKPKQ